MTEAESQTRVFLAEYEAQPEHIRRVLLYAICQTMVQAGTLLFLGAFRSPEAGVTLMYKNPDSGEVFEIVKPPMTDDEEQAMRVRIGELLQENAQAV